MKLKYYIKNNQKVYTLKETISKVEVKEAHYKFIKFKDEKENS